MADLARHARELISAELELARDEFADELRRARRGVTILLIGVATTQCGVLILALALPAALGAGPGEAAAIASVVTGLGLVAMLIAWMMMMRPYFVRTRDRLGGQKPQSEE